MWIVVAGVAVLALFWGLTMPRGLSDKELDKLAKAGLFPQAPGTRGPNDPHSPWFDASLVPDTTKAAAILGKERASDLMRRGWRFWGKP